MVAAYDLDVSIDGAMVAPFVQLSELESRLARGYDMIEEHRAAGLSVARLEEHWLHLLADYETLFDTLQESSH